MSDGILRFSDEQINQILEKGFTHIINPGGEVTKITKEDLLMHNEEKFKKLGGKIEAMTVQGVIESAVRAISIVGSVAELCEKANDILSACILEGSLTKLLEEKHKEMFLLLGVLIDITKTFDIKLSKERDRLWKAIAIGNELNKDLKELMNGNEMPKMQ